MPAGLALHTLVNLRLWRSRLRHSVDRLRDATGHLQPKQTLRWLQRQATAYRHQLSESELRACAARASGVHAASLTCVDEGLLVDLEGDDGLSVGCLLMPGDCRFATRGAKELSFLTQPPQAATHPLLRALVASLAQAIAQRLWMSPALAEGGAPAAVVEQDGLGRLRLDLRDLPAVRALQQRPGWGLWLESIELAAFYADRGGLRLQPRFAGQWTP